MKKKFFLLFSLFVTLNILSQQKIALKGIILDQDNLPIPYASIGIINKNIGTTSTEILRTTGGNSFLEREIRNTQNSKFNAGW